jgi:hypothetical protein
MRQGRLSLLTGAGGIMGRLTLPSIVQYEYGACGAAASPLWWPNQDIL